MDLCLTPPRQACGQATLRALLLYDAEVVATYEAALSRVVDPSVKGSVAAILQNHRRHVADLLPHVAAEARPQVGQSSERQLLLAGKVSLAQVLGDDAVVQALAELERDCNSAYERALGDDALRPSALAVVQHHFTDERTHQHWLRRALRPATISQETLMADDNRHGSSPKPYDTTAPEHERALADAARRARDGDVPPKAVQEQEQMKAAVQQQKSASQLAINEGGRTNDSSHTENPEGAVHGLPKPALRGTWR